MRCGYDKCERALSFHHRDATTKKFQICGNETRNWDVLLKELDKCDLICTNCHAEIHEELENKPIKLFPIFINDHELVRV